MDQEELTKPQLKGLASKFEELGRLVLHALNDPTSTQHWLNNVDLPSGQVNLSVEDYMKWRVVVQAIRLVEGEMDEMMEYFRKYNERAAREEAEKAKKK